MTAVTKQDFLLAVRKASFAVPEAYAVGGKIGEEHFGGIRDGIVKNCIVDSTMVRRTVNGLLEKTGLAIEAQALEFRDYPAVILTLTLTNPTAEPVTLDRFRLLRREFCGESPVILTEGGEKLALPEPPAKGQCCSAPAFSEKRYFLAFDECTVMIESECAKRFHAEPLGATAGVLCENVTVPAGQSVTLPSITLFVCEGDAERCRALIDSFESIHF